MDQWIHPGYTQYSRAFRASQSNHHLNAQMNVANSGQHAHSMNMNEMNMNGHHGLSNNMNYNNHWAHQMGMGMWMQGMNPSHSLNAAATVTHQHQTGNHHSDHHNHAASFNPASAFLHGYDPSSFLSGSFGASASKTGYMTTPSGFFNSMKKPDANMNMNMSSEMNMSNLRNATFGSHCTPMGVGVVGAPNMNMNNMSADPSSHTHSSLTAAGNLLSHLGPTSWRHNLIPPDGNGCNGPFGILPHEAAGSGNTVGNVMNTSGSVHTPHGGSHVTQHTHHSGSNSSGHHAVSATASSSSSKHHVANTESSKHTSSHASHSSSSHPKSSTASSSIADNSFRNIPASLQATQSVSNRGQAATHTFDHTTHSSNVARMSAHGHHAHGQADTSHYNLAALQYNAAAAAMNQAMSSEYATMQHNARYMPGMAASNQHAAFANNSSRSSAYPGVGFAADPTGRSRDLLGASSTAFLHSKQPSSSASSCNSRNMNMMNHANAQSYLSNCGMNNNMNNHHLNSTSAVNSNIYSPSSAAHSLVPNSAAAQQAVNTHSRSSSAASNHPLQQGNDSSSCSYYGSPAANTLPQSPYQQPQRSNTSNSSQGQGTPTANAVVVSNVQQQASQQDFPNYGSQYGSSMGAHTPVPASTPGGYPTPPSSVGQTHVAPQSNSQQAPTSQTSISISSSSHDDSSHSVSLNYPQLTPQTPGSSQSSTPFANNSYNSTTYPTTPKMGSSSSRSQSTESNMLPNTSSSCMVAAAAASMSASNSAQCAQVSRTNSYMMTTANMHETDPESCLSSIVGNVSSLANEINSDAAKLAPINTQMTSNQSEPTLNSVFSSPAMDFPSINFNPEDNHSNGVFNGVKLPQSLFATTKKKTKKGKKGGKKDKNKVVGTGMNVVGNAYNIDNYSYQQYQNSLSSLSYPNLVAASVANNNTYLLDQTQSNPESASGNVNVQQHVTQCYGHEMQYPSHHNLNLTSHSQDQQPIAQQHDAIQSLHHVVNDSMQQQSVQQTQQQHQQLMDNVMQIQQSTQQQHEQSISPSQTRTGSSPVDNENEKQTFPTIDDELSFLTEPTTECVSMETQTPSFNPQSQSLDNQLTNCVPNVSDGSDLNDPPVISISESDIQHETGEMATQATPAAFLKSYMSFIGDTSRSSPQPQTPSQQPVKEKKRKKHKENCDDSKMTVKENSNSTFNGQNKPKKNKNKKVKVESSAFENHFYDVTREKLTLVEKSSFQLTNENKEASQQLINYQNSIAMKKPGDNNSYESKFFKRRPSNNLSVNNVSVNYNELNEDMMSTNMNNSNKSVISKPNRKRKRNNVFTLPNAKQTPQHDEYEFPDSPLTSSRKSTKKQRKSSSFESSSKKKQSANDKSLAPNSSGNSNSKKSNCSAQKKSVPSTCVSSSSPTITTNHLTASTNSNNVCPIVSQIDLKCDNNMNNTNERVLAIVGDGNALFDVSTLHTTSSSLISASQSSPNHDQQQQTKQLSNNHNSVQINNRQQKPMIDSSNQVSNQQQQQTAAPQPVKTPTKSPVKQQQSQSQPQQAQSQIQTNSKKQSPLGKKNGVNTKQSPSLNALNSITPISTSSSSQSCNTNVVTTNSNLSSATSLASNSVGMTSAGTNTPRRRSQDKKGSTIREGMMRTGDFVVSIDESRYDLPVIWRIEGKSLLQRFEPTDQDGVMVYVNTSSYSAWNPTVRQRYVGIDVRVMGCSRTRIVVEKLGLTQANPNNVNGSTTIERMGNNKSAPGVTTSYHHEENFEVFIQTLISQALDPNFISEIVKENDEYFLSHVQEIDDVCTRKKSRFFSKIKWDANIVKCVETHALYTIIPQNNVGDLRCRLCHDNWSTQLLHFNGEPYNMMTLETLPALDIKQTKYAACDNCKDKIILYSNLHHQKYNFFTKCKSKVENMRGGDESKESHVILEQCLQDNEWIKKLFKELEEIWISCDKIR